MKKRTSQLAIFSILMLIGKLHATAAPGIFENFVTVTDDRLMDGNAELRFRDEAQIARVEIFYRGTNEWHLKNFANASNSFLITMRH